jgi:hypothetical protein
MEYYSEQKYVIYVIYGHAAQIIETKITLSNLLTRVPAQH